MRAAESSTYWRSGDSFDLVSKDDFSVRFKIKTRSQVLEH